MKGNGGSIMVRPTLIVGLGGTGVLVCQWLEKYIRDLFEGQVPPFIRFLKLDTDALEEGGPADAGLADFHNLFRNLDIGAVVRDCAKYPELHPHLDWFTSLRDKLDAVFADYGCQGIPRLGRLVFAEQRESIIHPAVSGCFSSLRAATQQDLKSEMGQFVVSSGGAPAVHLTASVCGGTGAGMLIDMAYNLRWWSKESFPRSAEIIGHLMLPEAFVVNPVLRPKLQAVAAATLEQIEFLSDPRRDDVRVTYPGSTGERCFDRLTAPFNFLYLLNGQGDLGVGNRKHLVKMIARAIRAMVLEPTSKLVASESNNKLADALGLYDPANGRRQCFASYGLWQGTPGQDHGDVLSWVGSRLREMKDVEGPADERIAERIGETIKPFLEVSTRVAEVGPGDSFEYTRNAAGIVVEDVQRAAGAYLDEKVDPNLRKKCEQVIKPDETQKKLLDAIGETIERLVFEEKSPLNAVPVGLNESIRYLEAWCRKEHSPEKLRYDAARGQLKQKVVPALERSAKNLGDITQLRPEQAATAVQELVRQNWDRLALTCLRETLRPAIDHVVRTLRLWKQAVDSLATLASDGSFSRKVMSDLEKEDRPDRSHEFRRMGFDNVNNGQIYFSTPMNITDDPTGDPNTTLGSELRQNLIKPILKHAVFLQDGLKEADSGIGGTQKRLTEAVRRLEHARQEYLKLVMREIRDEFHSTLGSNKQATDHGYFKPVTDIYDRATPKIDLDRANKFAEPLQVTISQHTKGCCVPDLLGHSLGADFREAYISEDFEERTKVWLQLLRINYGFCLEAISTYADYQAAARKYIRERTRFEDSNVWLDDNWYEEYLGVKQKWSQEKSRGDRGGRENDSGYDEIRMLRGRIRNALDTFFDALDQGLNECPPSAFRTAMKAQRLCTASRDRIVGSLRNLTPQDPRAMRKGLTKVGGDLEELLFDLNEPLKQMPGDYGMKVRQATDACRDLLRITQELLDKGAGDGPALVLQEPSVASIAVK